MTWGANSHYDFVRYLGQDDPEQSRKSERAIERARIEGEAMYVNHVVLCELAWTLSRGYGLPSFMAI